MIGMSKVILLAEEAPGGDLLLLSLISQNGETLASGILQSAECIRLAMFDLLTHRRRELVGLLDAL